MTGARAGNDGAVPAREPFRPAEFRPISDYALIGDCHSAALVSTTGSIDWCAFPRFDAGSCFGRLLDPDRGGFCSITPVRRFSASRRYVESTMVLETTLRSGGGEAIVLDCFTMRHGGARDPFRQILRVVDGTRGSLDLRVAVEPRFDYGDIAAWIRRLSEGRYAAVGGNDGLVFDGDIDLAPASRHALESRVTIRAGERLRLSITYMGPELIDESEPVTADEIDRRLDETLRWWRRWSKRSTAAGAHADPMQRSALVLKALQFAPTGAIVAAPTTSLPEAVGGDRNWDYRFSWVRDSAFTVRSLAQLGHDAEADGFRRFVERSAAGSADDLRIVYGVGGERRIGESTLDGLRGYRDSKPVRVGNDAVTQDQLDVFGHILDLAYSWHGRGHSPDDDYWRFLADLVDAACVRWRRPDRGIWEVRGRRRHFVHSKAMAWVALDCGVRLANECMRRASTRRWAKERDECRAAIESRGYDRRRGVFVRTFGSREMDASLLLLPQSGFIDWNDERMIRTVDVIREVLDDDGLLRRYESDDGQRGSEGAFLACSFWLAECLSRQGRAHEAHDVFDRATGTANDLGLFAEEFDTRRGEMAGNFPQGLTHLAHIAAAVALTEGADAHAARAV